MLSGHTHAGQIWPVGLFTTLLDKETINYGEERFGTMEAIVSSGIAGWVSSSDGENSEMCWYILRGIPVPVCKCFQK